MLRILGVLAIAALASPARATCSADRPRGARGDTIVVGFVASPPFVMPVNEDHAAHGFAIEVLRRIADTEGWQLELHELSRDTLRARLAECQLDVGVIGTVANSSLVMSSTPGAPPLEVSLPYFSSSTTAIVHGDDPERATPAGGGSALRRVARVAVAGGSGAALALAGLVLALWLCNAVARLPGSRALQWRRLDAAIDGPRAAVRWLARSTTGRVLTAVWLVVGFGYGAGPVLGRAATRGSDALVALVEQSGQLNELVGQRVPDGHAVECPLGNVRECFRGFAGGRLAAIAGEREVLCMYADEMSLNDDSVLRDDIEVREQLVYLLPPHSPLRTQFDLAILRQLEASRLMSTIVRCPRGQR